MDALSLYLPQVGFNPLLFSSSQELLPFDKLSESGCVLLDNSLPDMSGLDVQKKLSARGEKLPIVFMSGDSRFKDVVTAIQGGAVGFLEKPFPLAELKTAIDEALEQARQQAETLAELSEPVNPSLTRREKEVYKLAIKGYSIKKIAEDLHISTSTVEFHRSNILRKADVTSIAELIARALESR
jgi:FixJ family two-component response regulator